MSSARKIRPASGEKSLEKKNKAATSKDREAKDAVMDEEKAETTTVELAADKPTTFLAMNLDPIMVKRSSMHIERMARDAEENLLLNKKKSDTFDFANTPQLEQGKSADDPSRGLIHTTDGAAQNKEQNDHLKEKKDGNINLDNLAQLIPDLSNKTTDGSRRGTAPDSPGLMRQDNAKKTIFRKSFTGSISIPVNKMSIKLYGSEKAVLQEQLRMEKAGTWIIHPYSNFRFLWDTMSLFILVANLLIIPVAIAFWNEEDYGLLPVKIISDTWFVMDIFLNFRTGIVIDGPDSEVILDPKQIRIIYLKTWFTIDLLSTFPFDLLFTLVDTAIKGKKTVPLSGLNALALLRFAKILGLLRLLRLSRFIRYMKQWEELINFQYELALAFARIFNLIMLMLFICHINGCLQYMVPMFMNFPKDSWISIRGLENSNVTVWEKYSWSIFKSTSHMLCIGYGQFPPRGMVDLWTTFVSMVSGAMCFAMFIGNATSLIQSMDASKRAYKEKFMQVKEYMQFRKLPIPLRRRISDYYENRFQGKMFNEDSILAELNHNLREEIISYNCKDLVAQVPFFSEADPAFLTNVLSMLKFEVFLANDVIVKEGSLGTKMYFINRGTVVIRSERHNIDQRLSDGCYFGEIALLEENMRRVASVIAETYCYLYSLSVANLNRVMEDFPRQRQKLLHVATMILAGNASDTFNSHSPGEKKHFRETSHLEHIEEEPSSCKLDDNEKS